MSVRTTSAYRTRTRNQDLVPVLKKPTHQISKDQEVQNTIERFRMQSGDEGYKGLSSRAMAMTTKSNGGHNEINVRRHERDKEETRRNRARAMMQEAWRKDGRERRRILLEEDELTGGSDFHINHDN